MADHSGTPWGHLYPGISHLDLPLFESRDQRVFATTPILRGAPTPAREHQHVGRASTVVGILEPIHKKTGRTKSYDPQYTSFVPPEPPPHHTRPLSRSLSPPRRISISKERNQIKVGGRE